MMKSNSDFLIGIRSEKGRHFKAYAGNKPGKRCEFFWGGNREILIAFQCISRYIGKLNREARPQMHSIVFFSYFYSRIQRKIENNQEENNVAD